MSSIMESGSARRSRRRARGDAVKAQKKEDIRLAEAEGDIALTRAAALSGKAGRKSLIKSSPTGLATNLGGTSA